MAKPRNPQPGSKLHVLSEKALAAIEAAGPDGISYGEIADLLGITTKYASPLIGQAFNMPWDGWERVSRNTDVKPARYFLHVGEERLGEPAKNRGGAGRGSTPRVTLPKRGTSWEVVGNLKGQTLLSDGKGNLYAARPLSEVTKRG